jgi:hypothetical protein
MSTLVQSLRVNPRYDLQSSFVLISYEQTENVNGVSWMTPTTDQYPASLPGDALSFFNGLRFTVDLQGVQATTSTATLVCDAIDVTNPDWWIARHPQYEAHDPNSAAEDEIPIASFVIDFSTIKREPTNANEADKGYAQELTSGELTDWMTFKSQRITVSCRATIMLRNGQVMANHPITYQLVSTNAASGTFQNTKVQTQAEPVPVGLAQKLYNAVSRLQFEGELTFQEEDVSGRLGVGNLFNLTGGALAEWATMNALVQRITENLDAGTTTVEFGPPGILSAGELVDLLRVNRNRVVRYNVGLAIGGVPNLTGGNVSLGRNTPEKNSSSTTGYDQAHVVSGTIDGSGAVVATSPGVTQWLPSGPANPATPYPPGSVTIDQADAAGNTMKIQAVPVCFNGTKGRIYFLCSNFIPDT